MHISIVLLSILMLYMIYAREYNIKSEVNDIELAIEEFLETNITVIDFIKVDNKIVVYHTLGNNELFGNAILYKGLNSKYRIKSAGYKYKNKILMEANLKSLGKDYLVIMGTNNDHKISMISISTYSGEDFTRRINSESEIFEIIETKEKTMIKDFNLYDEAGNDITWNSYRTSTNENEVTLSTIYTQNKTKVKLSFMYIYFMAIVFLYIVFLKLLYKSKI